MWLAGEIVQGDSGQTVSNKLDAEFARLQAWETEVTGTLDGLIYSDENTIFDRTKSQLIVSPYTFWVGLEPEIVKIDLSKNITDHFTNQLFDGLSWMRTDVQIEYFGTFIPLADLGDGFLLTKAHYREFYEDLEDTFVKQDGSTPMITGYVPLDPLDVGTKEYVDSEVLAARIAGSSQYHEFPASSQGDDSFSANIGGFNYLVYTNGVLQRRNKYSSTDSGIVFNEPLQDKDEVTIVILGE